MTLLGTRVVDKRNSCPATKLERLGPDPLRNRVPKEMRRPEALAKEIRLIIRLPPHFMVWCSFEIVGQWLNEIYLCP